MGLAQKLVDGVLIMKNKFVFSLVLTLVWLSVCGVTCHPYDDMNFESLCWSNFYGSFWVPDGDSVWTEVYSGDTLLDVDSMMSPVHYSSLPNSELEFRERLTLRIHVFCNGEWLDGVDFEFENRTDKYTQVDLHYYDEWRSGSTVTRIFTDEQLAKCPELSEYRIYVNTEHPPDCPQFH